MLTDPHFLAVIIPAVIALGLAKGGFAGVGVVATPLLALVMPPIEAAAVLLPILMVQDVISVWVYHGDWSKPNLKVMVPGAALGVGAAWLLATYIPDAAVRVIVGMIGVGFVTNIWLGRMPEQVKPNPPAGFFWGAVSGFTSAFASAGGPPFQLYVLPQRLPKLTLVGTVSIFFAVVNLLKVMPYLALGTFSHDGVVASLAMLPLAIASNFAGIWLVRITPVKAFYEIIYALTFLLSLILIWQGGAELWRSA